MTIDIRAAGLDELAELLLPIHTAFGIPIVPERYERLRSIPEYDLRFGAYEDGAIVGSVASFTVGMTVPGGAAVETAGLTMVGVLPTHRRRGVLRSLMRRYLDETRARGQALSALFASEGAIYGRFGYGAASLQGEIEIDRERAAFPGPTGVAVRARLLTEDAALRVFPEIWDRARAARPGMLSRSPGWWRLRRLPDLEWARAGRGPLTRVVLDVDGRPAGYAFYRFTLGFDNGSIAGALDVIEAVGDSPAATRAVWRYLFDLDVVQRIKATLLPVDHPLLLLVSEPRRLHFRVGDALWVRLVDVEAALSRRSYGDGPPLVLEVEDSCCPWNHGRFRLEGGVARRTDEAADLVLDVSALGSAYLGGFGFAQLAGAGRVTERRAGALARADALFHAPLAPWCPEIF